MKKIISFTVLVLSVFMVSCGEKSSASTSVSLSFKADVPSDPATIISVGARASVFQIDGKGSFSSQKANVSKAGDGLLSFSGSFEENKSGTYKYMVFYPSLSGVNPEFVFPTSQSGSMFRSYDLMFGGCDSPSPGTEARVQMARYGAVVHVTIAGLPSTAEVPGITVTFPQPCLGKVTFDLGTMAPSSVSPSSSGVTISGASKDIMFRTLPLSLKAGQEINFSIKTSTATVTTTYKMPSDFSAQSGEVLEIPLQVSLGKTFTNPISTVARADPTIWYANGTFYMLSTNNSNGVFSSKDMITWSGSKVATPMSTTTLNQVKAYGNDLWAPDMAYVDGKWNYYVSARNSAADSGICVMQSSSPTGPFTFVNRVTDSKKTGISDSIDPELVIDPANGNVWLFFGSVGKMHRVRLNAQGTAVADGATYVHVAGRTPSECTNRSKVFEGCYLHRHGEYWYLFASSGVYSNATYKTVVGRSKTLEGTFVDKQGRKMTDGYASDVISSSEGDAFFGPGHNGEIFTDTTGQDYIFYHCHYKKPGTTTDVGRCLMLQRIFWDEDGWPYVEGGKPAASDLAPIL